MKTARNSFFEELRNENLTGVVYKNLQLKKKMLDYFTRQGPATINDVSKALNISSPKATSLINELIDSRLVEDNGKGESGVGRRPSLFGLTKDSFFFIGVEVKKDHIHIGITDFNNRLIKMKRLPYKLANNEAALEHLCELINSFIKSNAIEKKKIVALGINLSGRISHQTGFSYSFFNFTEDALSKIIKNKVNIPTYLENDSRAMAFGEFSNGVVKEEKNVLFVNVDHGLGLGIMINGALYYGKSGFAGEFGHIPFFNNELICHCGKKGCLETEVSGMAITEKFRKKMIQGHSTSIQKNFPTAAEINLDHIIKAAINDDVLAIELIDELGEKLGKAIAILINLYNPELIILGGSLAETGDHLLLPVKMAINKYSLSRVSNDTTLKLSQLGEKAGVIGACLLARNEVLNAGHTMD